MNMTAYFGQVTMFEGLYVELLLRVMLINTELTCQAFMSLYSAYEFHL